MAENGRIKQLEKQREKDREEFERQKAAIEREAARDRTSASRFTVKADSIEDSLKFSTIGLQQLSDFQEKRRALEEQLAREAARTDELKAEEAKKKKAKKNKKTKLSFAADDEEEQEEDTSRPAKKAKLGKNPDVDTTFLPDREREEEERREREVLRQQWIKRQEEIKNESITIIFSYWDGSGHRSDVECKKGDTIAAFLEKAKQQFPQIKGVGTDNLMYVKEDLIVPHHYTFYDFIVSRARGKSGPLFNFDVHEDVRMLADATKEKDESHAGKVVERAWYNRNKHIFPQSRWENFVQDKDYGNYKIRG